MKKRELALGRNSEKKKTNFVKRGKPQLLIENSETEENKL